MYTKIYSTVFDSFENETFPVIPVAIIIHHAQWIYYALCCSAIVVERDYISAIDNYRLQTQGV